MILLILFLILFGLVMLSTFVAITYKAIKNKDNECPAVLSAQAFSILGGLGGAAVLAVAVYAGVIFSYPAFTSMQQSWRDIAATKSAVVEMQKQQKEIAVKIQEQQKTIAENQVIITKNKGNILRALSGR
jgi:hypothetical protein